MNINHILTVVAQHDVQCLMIGGMNFLLRHQPVVTYDLGLWINDVPDNRRRCESALGELDAEWGVTDEDWGAALPNVRRNTRERCLELQQEKLAWLNAAEAEEIPRTT